MTTSASASTDAPRNRYAGPCSVCSTHVPAWQGTRRSVGGRWVVDCSAHTGGRSNAAPPSAPSNAAPAGERPHCSARTALASVALVRHAMRPGAPDDARETAIELSQLAVWASGSADAARALAAALGTPPAHEIAAAFRESVRPGPRAEPRGVGADLVGEILDRVNPHAELDDERGEPAEIPPPVNTEAAREPARTLVRCAGEDAGWLLSPRDGGDVLNRVIVRGVGEISIEHRPAGGCIALRGRTEIAYTTLLADGSRVWATQAGFGSAERSRTLAVLDAWLDANGEHIAATEARRGAPVPETRAPARRTPARNGSRWAHLKKQ